MLIFLFLLSSRLLSFFSFSFPPLPILVPPPLSLPPFSCSQVEFRDFFLADQLASIVIVLYDLEYTLCFFFSDAWSHSGGILTLSFFVSHSPSSSLLSAVSFLLSSLVHPLSFLLSSLSSHFIASARIILTVAVYAYSWMGHCVCMSMWVYGTYVGRTCG